MSVDDFTKADGQNLLTKKISTVLNIPSEQIVIKTVSSNSRRVLSNQRALEDGNSQTRIAFEIAVDTDEASTLVINLLNTAKASGTLAILGKNPATISYDIIKNGSSTVNHSVTIVVGCMVGLFIIVLSLLFAINLRRRKLKEKKKRQRPKMIPYPTNNGSLPQLAQVTHKDAAELAQKLKMLSSAKIPEEKKDSIERNVTLKPSGQEDNALSVDIQNNCDLGLDEVVLKDI